MKPDSNLVEFHQIKNSPERGSAMKPNAFKVGTRVRKVGGNYEANGTVDAAFKTRSGKQRYVFEFDDPAGMLHIFNHEQLERIENDE